MNISNCFRAFSRVAIAIFAGLLVAFQAESQINFTYHSPFSYLKGKDAASLPLSWITPGFDYSAWAKGNAPFRYGDGSSGVELTDMMNGYSTLYLKSTFQSSNITLLKQVKFTVDYDDGFVIWINGIMILAKNAPASLTYNSLAPGNHESGTGEVYTIDAGDMNLVEGSNSIAVLCFNVSLNSTDFYFDLAISAEKDMPETQDYAGVSFSKRSGFYDSPFELVLTSPDPGRQIVFTLDGTNPQSSVTGFVASSPATVNIDPSGQTGRPLTPAVVVRASVADPGFKPAKPVSATYIFLDKVKKQKYPGGAWPPTSVNGQLIDLEIDTMVVRNPAYSALFNTSLKDIPTISIITDPGNLFDPASGIYVNAEGHGLNWEKECSVELFYPDDTDGFKINAGLRIRGGYSRRDDFPKHAFRLFFRELYGTAKLNYPLFGEEGVSQFDKIDLRSEQNYAWNNGGSNNSFVRDVFSRDTQRDMGQPYTRSRYYHLYLNGMYWGMYQTQERSEARFAASYFGGDNEDYDVIKVNGENYQYKIEASDGTLDSWQRIWNMCSTGFASNSSYFALEGKDKDGKPVKGGEVMLDIDNLIDYMLVIFYSGNFDGPMSKFLKNKVPNNFYAIDDREDKSKGFTFYAHDNEHTLFDEPHPPGTGINENRVNIGSLTDEYRLEIKDFSGFNPQWLHFKLTDNSEYRQRFADRAYNHFQKEGVFSSQSALARLNPRIEEVDLAVIAESARWGNSKRGSASSYTRNDQWIPEINKLKTKFMPVRPAVVIAQLKNAGLYPAIEAPVISKYGEEIIVEKQPLTSEIPIEITNPNQSGNIYYTLNGNDPRNSGGGFNSGAVFSNTKITRYISESTVIIARIFDNGRWSAPEEIRFIKKEDGYPDLKVTEVHYHPEDLITGSDTLSGKDFEFIEFKNTGDHSINLSGLELDSAVRFKFPDNTLLPPGKFFVITSKPAAFYEYYGLIASGNFQGNLSNAGEEILLRDSDGNAIINFVYGDSSPWPGSADGDGYSMVSSENNPDGNPNDYFYWRNSAKKGGNPFADNFIDDADPVSNNHLLIEAYPNPTKGIINISVLADEETRVYDMVLTDIAGKTVYQVVAGNQAVIDLRNTGVRPGIYTLKVTSGRLIGWVRIVFVK
jgi:hypothetical protein